MKKLIPEPIEIEITEAMRESVPPGIVSAFEYPDVLGYKFLFMNTNTWALFNPITGKCAKRRFHSLSRIRGVAKGKKSAYGRIGPSMDEKTYQEWLEYIKKSPAERGYLKEKPIT